MRWNTVRTIRWAMVAVGLVAGMALLARGDADRRGPAGHGHPAGRDAVACDATPPWPGPGSAAPAAGAQRARRRRHRDRDRARRPAPRGRRGPHDLRRRRRRRHPDAAGRRSRRARRECQGRSRGRRRATSRPTAHASCATVCPHWAERFVLSTPSDAYGRVLTRAPSPDLRESVSRTVMLSRPAASPSPSGAVPRAPSARRGRSVGSRRRTRAGRRLRSSRSMNGPMRRSTPANRNVHVSPRLIVTTGASTAPRRPGAARAGRRRVEVDDRRVGRVRAAPRRRRTCRPRAASAGDEVGGHRLDRRAVGVVGGAAVGVRLPVPAEAHRLHAHEVTGGHARVAQPCRRPRPIAELGDERALRVEVEPVGDEDDARAGPDRAALRLLHDAEPELRGLPAGASAGGPERDLLATEATGGTRLPGVRVDPIPPVSPTGPARGTPEIAVSQGRRRVASAA